MGEQRVNESSTDRELGVFMKHLLRDVHALELLIEKGMIETEKRRIGAEQELFLVDADYQPYPGSMEVLKKLDSREYTTELARFNLEFNLDPIPFDGDCLRNLERQLTDRLEKVRNAARQCGCRIILTGILPTLKKSDLDLENMTPRPRYFALNEAMSKLRGRTYEFEIHGLDELIVRHDNVMLEACNTSFQLHFQVAPSEFARLYNIAQLVTPPLLAGAANSPLLFGRRLWRETRIAVFQQAVDTRRVSTHLRESKGRVSFGTRWIDDSILEIFKEDIARYRLILGTEIHEDPFEAIKMGDAPELKALCLHNSTIYRWNRPCYGISGGKPHLRIENRVLPSGPSPIDSIANAAFFFGLLSGFSIQYPNPAELIDFGDVQSNFLAAAQVGLGAQFNWFGGRTVPARELICRELIPLAREGLISSGIDREDIDQYLQIFQGRVEKQQTGAEWILGSLAGMKGQGSRSERLSALTSAMIRRQSTGRPVHEWEMASLEEAGGWKPSYMRVDQIMRSDLVTVRESDTVELVANLMDWERIRHIPVEDSNHRLVGLVSYRSLLRYYGRYSEREKENTRVTEIMTRNVVTVQPKTPTIDALQLMRSRKVGCLPVVDEGRLVGILTERDFMVIAGVLLEKGLTDS